MELKNLSFSGKTAIVTGAAQGIGRAIAGQLAELGAQVVILDVNALESQRACREIGPMCGFYPVDLADSDAVVAVMEQVIRDKGRIDVLINNAGIVNTSDFDALSKADWDRVLAVDLTAVFLTCQTIFRHMAAGGGGRIVNVASIAGKVGGGYLGTAAYAAAKAGVISLTKSVAKAGADKRIFCNSVCPAYTKTPLVRILTGEKERKVLDAMSLHRAANPSEVANAVLFLASGAASFITGENINCDGGMLMDG
jgi:3-oxoacyl-[acyl-carrier protein] reductase